MTNSSVKKSILKSPIIIVSFDSATANSTSSTKGVIQAECKLRGS